MLACSTATADSRSRSASLNATLDWHSAASSSHFASRYNSRRAAPLGAVPSASGAIGPRSSPDSSVCRVPCERGPFRARSTPASGRSRRFVGSADSPRSAISVLSVPRGAGRDATGFPAGTVPRLPAHSPSQQVPDLPQLLRRVRIDLPGPPRQRRRRLPPEQIVHRRLHLRRDPPDARSFAWRVSSRATHVPASSRPPSRPLPSAFAESPPRADATTALSPAGPAGGERECGAVTSRGARMSRRSGRSRRGRRSRRARSSGSPSRA